MDIIELAREIGRKIQKDEDYIKMRIAEEASNADADLQNMVGEFNLKRMAINNEASKLDRDDKKLEELNAELRSIYADIMQNENMAKYNEVKQAFDTKLQRVLTIINNCAEGADPETTDYVGGCTGSCSSCSGCH